jgi:hypothetical protein
MPALSSQDITSTPAVYPSAAQQADLGPQNPLPTCLDGVPSSHSQQGNTSQGRRPDDIARAVAHQLTAVTRHPAAQLLPEQGKQNASSFTDMLALHVAFPSLTSRTSDVPHPCKSIKHAKKL